jgi:hypothetical protein
MAYDAHAAAIREKRTILRREYGGMMSVTDLTHELGYASRQSTSAWIKMTGILGTKIGRSVKYDTDCVAKILVDARGMY